MNRNQPTATFMLVRKSISNQIQEAAAALGVEATCRTIDGALRWIVAGRIMTPGEAADYLLDGGPGPILGRAETVVHPDRLAEKAAGTLRLTAAPNTEPAPAEPAGNPPAEDAPTPSADPFADADYIHVYTRAHALADGELVDAGPAAREAGFVWPVALTRSVWEDCVQWDDGDRERKPGAGQDEAGRLWDVLSMARFAIKRTREHGQRLEFEVLRVPRTGKGLRPQLVHLVLACGPGDDAEPVITIMRPDED